MGLKGKIGIAGLLLALTVGGVFFHGNIDLGADSPHWPWVASIIEHYRDAAIRRNAADIAVPVKLDDPALIRTGAEHYEAMCTGCHLSPENRDSEIRAGLYPRPPDLSQQRIHDPAEAFWVIKHGIKFTAMPAWGASHGDDDIWAMVAFLKKLPSLSMADYQHLVQEADTQETNVEPHHHHHHEHPPE